MRYLLTSDEKWILQTQAAGAGDKPAGEKAHVEGEDGESISERDMQPQAAGAGNKPAGEKAHVEGEDGESISERDLQTQAAGAGDKPAVRRPEGY